MHNPLIKLQELILCERINSGDAEAFAEVYDRYAPRLLRHLLLRTSQKEIAEDILSKVFLHVWEYVRAGKELRSLQSFLYTVTNNALVDHYRRTAKGPIIVEDITAFDKPMDSKTIPLVDASINKVIVQSALAKLKPEYRDVLVLKYIDELDVSEIAELLATTPNAVYIRVFRAIKLLKDLLQEKYEPQN